MKTENTFWVAGAFLCAMATATSGCVHRYTNRVEYELGRYGDLLVTNSPSLFQPPPKGSGGAIQATVTIVVENAASHGAIDLRPGSATFVVEGEVLPSHCLINGRAASAFSLGAGKKAGLQCKATIKADATNRLAMRDAVGTFRVPYGPPSENRFVALGFKFKIEDFE